MSQRMDTAKQKTQGKRLGASILLGPCTLSFAAGFCVMVLELTAGRIVSRYLGTSLYTWSSVIGIVLAGIAAGNYLGGLLADRLPPKKLLAALFLLASGASLFVPFLNRYAGESGFMWALPWLLRVGMHITGVFLIPAIILGAVTPVVVKSALDKGLPAGFTVGSVYSMNVLGSILGTFLTGFFLIPFFGTVKVIGAVCIVLAASGTGLVVSSAFSSMNIVVLILFLAGQLFAAQKGFAVFLADSGSGSGTLTLHESESRYSHLRIMTSEAEQTTRILVLDQIANSVVNLEKPWDLDHPRQYPYLRIYRAVTDSFYSKDQPIKALVLGGGGYVWPQYLQMTRPGSRIDVVEIDPEVTRAARKYLQLPEDPGFNIHHQDARLFVNSLYRARHSLTEQKHFDIIYADIVSGLSVPHELSTHEYFEQAKDLLSEQGVYALNLIDSLHSGRLLGSLVKTLRKSFPYVYVFRAARPEDPEVMRDTFVIAAVKEEIRQGEVPLSPRDGFMLSEERVEQLVNDRDALILTDDHAPVEMLLAPVYFQAGREKSALKMAATAKTHQNQGDPEKAIAAYEKAIEMQPQYPVFYNDLGNLYFKLGELKTAEEYYDKAVETSPDYADAYANLGTLYASKGDLESAVDYFQQALARNPQQPAVLYNLAVVHQSRDEDAAAEGFYKRALDLKAGFSEALVGLGNLSLKRKELDQAASYYREALKFNAKIAPAYNNLGAIAREKGNFQEAGDFYRKALDVDPAYQQARRNLESLPDEKRP